MNSSFVDEFRWPEKRAGAPKEREVGGGSTLATKLTRHSEDTRIPGLSLAHPGKALQIAPVEFGTPFLFCL